MQQLSNARNHSENRAEAVQPINSSTLVLSLSHVTAKWEIGAPCQCGFLFAAGVVGAGDLSSHAGTWILEVAIAFAFATRSLKGLSQPR